MKGYYSIATHMRQILTKSDINASLDLARTRISWCHFQNQGRPASARWMKWRWESRGTPSIISLLRMVTELELSNEFGKDLKRSRISVGRITSWSVDAQLNECGWVYAHIRREWKEEGPSVFIFSKWKLNWANPRTPPRWKLFSNSELLATAQLRIPLVRAHSRSNHE